MTEKAIVAVIVMAAIMMFIVHSMRRTMTDIEAVYSDIKITAGAIVAVLAAFDVTVRIIYNKKTIKERIETVGAIIIAIAFMVLTFMALDNAANTGVFYEAAPNHDTGIHYNKVVK